MKSSSELILESPLRAAPAVPVEVRHDGVFYALIIPANYRGVGVNFFTPADFSQQVAYMHHQGGRKIDAHVHNHSPRQVHFTQEALIIRRGRLRVDFYTPEQEYVESRILEAGDVILLVDGGHGFEVLEEVEMIEIKQGPYLGENDKARFAAIAAEKVRIVE